MPSESQLMVGSVGHRRLLPTTHQFRYKVMMLWVDLDNAEALFEKHRFWSTKRWALGQFKANDYMNNGHGIKQTIADFILSKTQNKFEGKVFLLTNPRLFGFIINPISVYFCYDQSGTLIHQVLEVTNTPWNEKVQYLLDIKDNKPVYQFAKQMHVSPFNDMALDYLWQCQINEEDDHHEIDIKLDTKNEKGVFFESFLSLSAKPLNQKALSRVLLIYPMMTVKVISAIYWQALKLFIKKTPLYRHPNKGIQSES